MEKYTSKNLRTLAWIAATFALVVIVFGAFVRLSNAGLSCPDWPTCYGKLSWPTQTHEVAAANVAFPDRPVEPDKAWREQVHRMLVGGLSLVTFALAGFAFVRLRRPSQFAVAGRPVRARQARVRQSHERAKHDYQQRKGSGNPGKPGQADMSLQRHQWNTFCTSSRKPRAT